MSENLGKYIGKCVSRAWLEQYEAVLSKFHRGEMGEYLFDERVKNLAQSLSEREVARFEQSVKRDFGMTVFKCTRHFLARLLSRFSDSFMPFLMSRLARLIANCRKRKKERSRGDGLLLVMDPNNNELITIFASA